MLPNETVKCFQYFLVWFRRHRHVVTLRFKLTEHHCQRLCSCPELIFNFDSVQHLCWCVARQWPVAMSKRSRSRLLLLTDRVETETKSKLSLLIRQKRRILYICIYTCGVQQRNDAWLWGSSSKDLHENVQRVFALWSQILREAAPVIQRPRAGGACVCVCVYELWPRAPHWAFTSPALLLRSLWSRWTPSARVILLNSMWCYWCWITAEPPTTQTRTRCSEDKQLKIA